MCDLAVIQEGSRFRVQRADGSLLPGRFHYREQADEHRLQQVATHVLSVINYWQSDWPSRTPYYPRIPWDVYGENERRLGSPGFCDSR